MHHATRQTSSGMTEKNSAIVMSEELIEQGIVLKSEKGISEIELISNDNCEECSAKLFCKPREDSSRILQVPDTTKLKEGDKVSIAISGKSLLTASFNLYLYPLLILIFSILIGTRIFSNSAQSELLSLSIGIFFISIYYLTFFKISKKISTKKSNVLITKMS